MATTNFRYSGQPSTEDARREAAANEWTRCCLRLIVSSTLHPFEYAKVLIQLGYEPIASRPGTTIFGRPIQVLPNIFTYAGYIRRMDGFFGCYRGLTPKIIGSIVSIIGSDKIANHLELDPYEERNKDDDAELYIHFKTNLKRDVVLTTSGIILSHPFHVISLRMMAQFIGRENLYKSIFSSISEIYKNEGLAGFFSGLVPKLMCDVACVILTSSTVFILNKYLIKDKIFRQYNAGLTQFAFASILYPLQVVSTCMAVTGSRLMAARPPIMPKYADWIDCLNDLKGRGELKRGSSLFWRHMPEQPKNRLLQQYLPLPKLTKFL